MWIFIALLAPAFYGVSNIFDTILVTKNFKNPFVLVFFTSLFNLIFIPFLWIIGTLPTLSEISIAWPIFLLLGLINVSYLYPYYKGLQSDDTSTVVSFFGLGRIIIPILAFIIVGETLSFYKYVGIVLVVSSVIFLSVEKIPGGVRFSKALKFIALAAFITSFEGVLFKYLYTKGISVTTAVSGELIVAFILAMLLPLFRPLRREIRDGVPLFWNKIHLFFVEELATFLAFLSESYALKIAPVSLVKSITIFTPFFVLFYAKLLGKRFKNTFNERKERKYTIKKFVFFTTLAMGILLVAG